MKHKITARVVYEYLEEKILTDDYSNDDLELYIDIKKYGSGVMNDEVHKNTLINLYRECADIYEGRI